MNACLTSKPGAESSGHPKLLRISPGLQDTFHVLPQPVPCHFVLCVPILGSQGPARGGAHCVHGLCNLIMAAWHCMAACVCHLMGASLTPLATSTPDNKWPQCRKHHGAEVRQCDGLSVLGKDQDQYIALFLRGWSLVTCPLRGKKQTGTSDLFPIAG